MTIDLEKFKDVKILVVGDIMLDEYVSGEAYRLSPEAPVPVILNPEIKYVLGGAGNVVANVASLGAQVEVFGVMGKEVYGDIVKNKMLEIGINNLDGLVEVGNRLTTRKRRIFANGQQVARIDFEETTPVYAEIDGWLPNTIEWADLVIISDYAKGFITRDLMKLIRALCVQVNTPFIVDPKGDDFEKYNGALVITPNEKEMVMGHHLHWLKGIQNVLITEGSKGMSLFLHGPHNRIQIPAEAKQVFDVSGAGDTVISAIGVALAAGYSFEESARFANKCAGIVVGKPWTAVMTIDDLRKKYEIE